MNKKNGFTLVELLAIIVILSIIAFITIPKINQITEKSRRDSAAVSALGYIDAVEKYYFEKNQNIIDEFVFTGEYDVENGSIIDGTETHRIKVKGTIPSNGSLVVRNGDVLSGCLTLGKYKVEIENEEVSSVEKGQLKEAIDLVEGLVKPDGYKYLLTPITVYFNPVTGEKCTDYDDDNSAKGVADGCMKWYAYSIKGKVTNMLLDHFINTSEVAWLSEEDFNYSSSIGEYLGVSNMGNSATYGGANNKGPLTVLGYLKARTAGWSTSVMGKYNRYVSSKSFIIDYSSYKSRLITIQEVAYIVGENFDEATSSDSFNGLPDWLFILNGGGYWTSSVLPTVSNKAWDVGYNSSGNGTTFSNPISAGYNIRPVITVPTSMVLLDD